MRQLALFSLLAYLPALLNPWDAVLDWMHVHAWFLLLWALGCLSFGYFAVRWTDAGLFDRDRGESKLAGLAKRWGRCPRCVGYWTGGFFSCGLSSLYWQRFPAALYFLLLGASLSASVSLAIHLYRMFRDYDPDQ